MDIYLLRHGETAYNMEKRYLGSSDISLSAKGLAELTPAGFSPEKVYVSPLRRTWETAGALFPAARQIVIDDFREMDFGIFEGKTYQEMACLPEYQAWIDGYCLGKIPGGEQKTDFCRRTCEAFVKLVNQTLDAGGEQLVIVAHGGTQMAVMERFVRPVRDYFSWNGPNGGGFVLDASLWLLEGKLTLRETVRYTGGTPKCC
ncbi:MAG: histidine phosphatase family protein [Oscillospiraceae bacterium]|nr:histidine phosphatase family protein [Oscillospiraceae bacterium]